MFTKADTNMNMMGISVNIKTSAYVCGVAWPLPI